MSPALLHREPARLQPPGVSHHCGSNSAYRIRITLNSQDSNRKDDQPTQFSGAKSDITWDNLTIKSLTDIRDTVYCPASSTRVMSAEMTNNDVCVRNRDTVGTPQQRASEAAGRRRGEE